MLKLALIGREIQHSLSQSVYEEILKAPVNYQLLDYENEKNIPSLSSLLNQFDGISVTAPYKSFIFNKVQASEKAKLVKGVNCIKLASKEILGTITDYPATDLLFKKYYSYKKFARVVLLGDGVMAKIVEDILNREKIGFFQFSRRKNQDFHDLNHKKKFPQGPTFIINTCSRDYVYSSDVKEGDYFWNFNYHHFAQEYIKEFCSYIDGKQLLKEQAKFALKYWGHKF